MSKNVKMTNPMKVITGPNTRWSYANVWEPKSINGGTPKYSVSLTIPKSDTILVNICIGCFACVGLTTAISMIQSIINDHKREKREQEKDKRDLEYHEKRMKDFK